MMSRCVCPVIVRRQLYIDHERKAEFGFCRLNGFYFKIENNSCGDGNSRNLETASVAMVIVEFSGRRVLTLVLILRLGCDNGEEICTFGKVNMTCSPGEETVAIYSAVLGRVNATRCHDVSNVDEDCSADIREVLQNNFGDDSHSISFPLAESFISSLLPPCVGGLPYSLQVTHRCIKVSRLDICDGKDVSVECKDREVIRIRKSFYDRTRASTCHRQPRDDHHTNCQTNVLSQLKNRCDQYRRCDISVKQLLQYTTTTDQRSCHDSIGQYLQLPYSCVHECGSGFNCSDVKHAPPGKDKEEEESSNDQQRPSFAGNNEALNPLMLIGIISTGACLVLLLFVLITIFVCKKRRSRGHRHVASVDAKARSEMNQRRSLRELVDEGASGAPGASGASGASGAFGPRGGRGPPTTTTDYQELDLINGEDQRNDYSPLHEDIGCNQRLCHRKADAAAAAEYLTPDDGAEDYLTTNEDTVS